MIWQDILANPGVGNLLLLIAAIIGVGGSYYIYRSRMQGKKHAARRALKSELELMTVLTQWIENDEGVPQQCILPTAAYKAHLENIGLLTDQEAEKLTSFYSQAIILDDVIKHNRDIIIQSSLRTHTVDRGKKEREQVIAQRLDHLAIGRWQAIQLLKKHLNEPYEPPEKLDLPKTKGVIIQKSTPSSVITKRDS